MNSKLLIAGAAFAALSCGAASAHHGRTAANIYAAPDQPVPYAQLDGYLKATPSQRAQMASNTGAAPVAANTGTASTDAASTAPMAGSDTNAGMSSQPNGGASANGAVNPPIPGAPNTGMNNSGTGAANPPPK